MIAEYQLIRFEQQTIAVALASNGLPACTLRLAGPGGILTQFQGIV